jgi:hypothetical protein
MLKNFLAYIGIDPDRTLIAKRNFLKMNEESGTVENVESNYEKKQKDCWLKRKWMSLWGMKRGPFRFRQRLAL